jgi:DNA mismatch repair protein MutS2
LQEGSRIGWYDRVLTNFGDEQSLERSLSTFSAEIANLARIIEAADERSLVLLDEIAASTDPEEGSALAAAALEALVERGAAVAATTHYERLKELAGGGQPFVNASVGFDFDRMQPTFKLTTGVPGASSALAVAARHGLPAAVVDRATQLLSRSAVDRQRLLEQLEHERLTLHSARAQAERDAAQVHRLRDELEAERRIARQKERKRLAGEAAELTRAVREARDQLREVRQRLRAPLSRQSLRHAERDVDAAARQVAIGSPLQQATEVPETASDAEPLCADELHPGRRVYLPKLGATGELVEAPVRGQVRVRVGGLTSRVPVTELRRGAAQQRHSPAPRPKPTRHAAPGDHSDGMTVEQRAIRTSDNTCDLRGQRVDEALSQLDEFLDRCLQTDETVGFVLHGHGTGALKQAVREHLALSQLVARSRPAEQLEGGDAFTVFWLQP